MSVYAKAFLYFLHLNAAEWAKHFEFACDASPDEVSWQELNPRYMGPCALQAAVVFRLLPAWVVDTGQAVPTRKKSKGQQTSSLARTTTPLMPAYGPFKVGNHVCKPAVGFCGTCGQYHGEEYRGKAARYHRKEFADFGKLDAETQRVRWEGAWREMTHARGAMPPFHGNDFERRFAGGGGANEGLVSPDGEGEEQQTLMPQDDSTMLRDGFDFNDADMTDLNPNAPSTQEPRPNSNTNLSSTTPSSIQQPTFLPNEHLHCEQDFPAMPSIEQFNRTSNPKTSPDSSFQAEKYHSANEPSHSGQHEPNTAGEWMDTMEES
ncbi:hypothetical protein M409DRAFT_26710 [Zasmidium cellare ATCC 36951]|uniref:Uncharacterized protein n=1 Tax=Zasmidium cellare ATCC 36951 TaxID=1080233 RepID=A0A6A6C741_ZASCE|nr:uncharacterized protein M409DRAFT_26710 [Zasmidium cellare ATCC 36951]KAF2162855.1 hypothetical protein M409DRAFT_26710 [Zasmidium cellare ATCC 36951]